MISIIIPVFNEEERLRESLGEICSYLKSKRIDSEVIVVNDGSTDSTGKVLLNLQNELNFKIFTHNQNLGKGAAIKTGINNSLGDKILFTDIDLSVPFEFVKKYIDALTPETDVVIGTRANKDSKVEIRQFWLREMMGGMYTHITNLILQVGVSDFTCGFKLFRKEAALKIFNKQKVKRWSFDAESLYLAKKYHFNIKEIPVLWRHRSGSKVKFPQDLFSSLFSLIGIRVNSILGSYD